MKISSIHNYNSRKQNTAKKQTAPSFNARVNVIWEQTKDVISGDYLTLNKEPLKTLVDKILPHLQNLMDDNLRIDVTAAGRPPSLWNMFKSNAEGLKFDMRFHDGKRYYYDVLMKDNVIKALIDPIFYEGLMNKEPLLVSDLNNKLCVGRLYEPQKGDTPEIFVKAVMPKIKEHLRLLPKIFTERKDTVYDAKNKEFARLGGVYSSGSRYPWEHYRGIEYDYKPILKEYYK